VSEYSLTQTVTANMYQPAGLHLGQSSVWALRVAEPVLRSALARLAVLRRVTPTLSFRGGRKPDSRNPDMQPATVGESVVVDHDTQTPEGCGATLFPYSEKTLVGRPVTY